jgi:4-hydroxybenzoate polyprenyltransferase
MPALSAAAAAFARDIKLSHTIFALPFALSSGWLASRDLSVPWTDWLWIVLAMVGARSSAMGMNRLLDRHIDAANPRTARREIPAGNLPVPLALAFTLGSAGLFALAAALLSPLCLALSPLVLAVLWGYSLTKRYTSFCHIVLGLALGLAPICAWLALRDSLSLTPILMGLAVLCWVGGFDILYALQDREYDQSKGLNSMPVALGEEGALWLSRLLHLGAVGLFFALPVAQPLGWPYLLAATGIAGLLGWEHSLVKPGDLSRIDQAFFTANSFVSIIFLAGVLASGLT